MSVSKDQIPETGDRVVSVDNHPDLGRSWITFESGKVINCETDFRTVEEIERDIPTMCHSPAQLP